MFDRGSLPPFRPRLAWPRRGCSGYARSALIRMGLAIALAVSAAVVSSKPASAAEGPQTDGPSIQYQEALAHASKTYPFAPGGVATVPFQPRPGDSNQVDGAAPIALPAGRGSELVTPNVADPATATPNGIGNLLRREVFGFLPYWTLGAGLDYDTLSTVAYFGVGLNGDGTLARSGNGWNGWVSSTMTSVINNAHAHGTRVALTIESFAWDSGGAAMQAQILSSPAVSLTAAQQIAAEVGRMGADGVNLDFEPIASGQYTNFVTFTRLLRTELDKVHPGYELTFCATGAPGTYDLPNLLADGAADAVFIMGYDLRGGTPATTGSIDPLTSATNHYTLSYVVGTFRDRVPASKIILGLPWYGHAWSTGPAYPVVNAPPADIPTYGSPATGITYATAKSLADRDPATTSCTAGWPTPCVTGWQYDSGEQSAWTAYYGDYSGTQTTWRELYFDDARAVGAKCDAIDGWNLRGVGIWALGYDSNNGGDGDLMNAIAAKFKGIPTTYVPLTPARILDTRYGTGLSGAFTSRAGRTFQVTGHGGVPANAIAVTGNLTVTGQTSRGYLYVGPVAMNNPTTSTLNFPVGDDRANAVTVALGGGGTLSVTYASPNNGTTAHAIFDVTGYFTPDTSGATFHSLAPGRILDTRSNTGLAGPFGSHVARTWQVTGGVVPSSATAVTGNLTVTGQTSRGYLYVGPEPMNNPTTSTLNFPVGDDRANAVTVALGAGGTLSVTYASPTLGPTAHVIFDVTGYFTPDTSGAKYVPLTPARLVDTRYNTGLSGPSSSHVARTFQVTGFGGVAAISIAVTGNLTVTGQTSLGYLYVGPVAMNDPTTSTLNFPRGDDRANAVTVALGTGGTLSVTYAAPTPGPTAHVIFDATGYFVP
ncbi:MAG: glycosyl hydrolase family 18 protein [Candidatus Limnocylindrales bacterium]